MNFRENDLSENDYLDLYLFANSMNDTLWKVEIIEKLQNFHNENRNETAPFVPKYLLDKYKEINEEIRTNYRQMRTHSSNKNLLEKVEELKKQRIFLTYELQLIKCLKD